MARKKWTPQTEITGSLLKIREKRKWQLGYRRYILENAPSESYAPYFGLDVATLKRWFELQFTEGMNWDNYGKTWQFDHIVPATYFDYSDEEDLKLCWSFINMTVAGIDENKARNGSVDILAVKSYFREMYDNTGFFLYEKMLVKITSIESASLGIHAATQNFIIENKTRLENIAMLTHEEFNSLNQGMTLEQILLEKEILRKFGAA